MSSPITIIEKKLLSDHWFILHKYIYDLKRKNGGVVRQIREVYDRGDGATILLYNREKGTVILTRQFRIPTYLNGNESGMLLETCAGLLDDHSPEECIRNEAVEETGYTVGKVEKLFDAYMSPGGVTERVYFFAAEYDESLRENAGGGVEDEDIEVLELPFTQAMDMVKDGRIKDAKTIMLLQHAYIQGWFGGKESR
ncbi:GDP-mannose pyrophosphatase NudK [Brenneria corticis]|uniref:GDP-mannose pyrophosphatase n=1 Tax=Brenneria corticis TaxID=2173106 RepID=A0A2U1U7L6_9GAMM|nr:GDP-mannose pyrophosphatase NudK [Brenneria sp. CFCC 11842]PWC17658.1 GDP-mannose pyrophosphatase NudK [Brenneria sp. CFCC 11842]